LTAPLQRQRPQDRLAAGVKRRPAPTAQRIARRRFMVGMTKWTLPLVALALLGSIAAWPEIARITDHSRVAFRRAMQLEPESGQMLAPHYHGVDQRGRPYTVTATSADQTSPERVALINPKGDLTLENGTWVFVQAKDGVFIQHQSLLDLSHDVYLYREDGTTLETDAAAMDLRSGAGTSSDLTHSEGPFGSLDAQGFTLTDKGSVIQFQGPAHAILNAAEAKPAAVTPNTTVTGVTPGEVQP
jgi:lipopolysaccharide export system protein LptC